MNISNNITSINNSQSQLNSTANNIANIGSKASVDLAKEIPNLITSEASVGVNSSAIKAQDEMLGSLLDIKA